MCAVAQVVKFRPVGVAQQESAAGGRQPEIEVPHAWTLISNEHRVATWRNEREAAIGELCQAGLPHQSKQLGWLAVSVVQLDPVIATRWRSSNELVEFKVLQVGDGRGFVRLAGGWLVESPDSVIQSDAIPTAAPDRVVGDL